MDGAGAVKRVQGGEIFNARRLVAAKNVAHAVGFKLKDGGGVAASKKLVSFFVVQRQVVDINFSAAILLDHAHRIMQNGERCQAKKIHLQQADALQRIHVKLRGDFIAIRLVERHHIGERTRRNHHTCRVRRRVARQSLQA